MAEDNLAEREKRRGEERDRDWELHCVFLNHKETVKTFCYVVFKIQFEDGLGAGKS